MLTRSKTVLACVFTLCQSVALAGQGHVQGETIVLENGRIGLRFGEKTGTLAAIENRLTGETYRVEGDGFQIEADEFTVGSGDCRLGRVAHNAGTLMAIYEGGGLTVEVAYALGGHFVEKRLTLQADRAYNLRKVVLSRPRFILENLTVIAPYRYQQNVTYFGRTPKGGFFAGVELPFDTSLLEGDRVTLAYRPGIRVKAGQRVECEPAYWGVYRRGPDDPAIAGELRDGSYLHLPSAAESDAMVAMVSEILGPPRHGPNIRSIPIVLRWDALPKDGPAVVRRPRGTGTVQADRRLCGRMWDRVFRQLHALGRRVQGRGFPG